MKKITIILSDKDEKKFLKIKKHLETDFGLNRISDVIRFLIIKYEI